jgi:hypothetical protein
MPLLSPHLNTAVLHPLQALNLLCCFIEDPSSEALKKHLARVPDYLWLAEDGMKMQVNALRTPLPPVNLKCLRRWSLCFGEIHIGGGEDASGQSVILRTEHTGNHWMGFLGYRCVISQVEKTAFRRWKK